MVFLRGISGLMGKGQQTKQGQKEQLRKRLLSLGTAKSKQSCSQASSSALHIVPDNCKESRAGMCSSPYSNTVESVGISILLTSHKQHRINSKHKWRGGTTRSANRHKKASKGYSIPGRSRAPSPQYLVQAPSAALCIGWPLSGSHRTPFPEDSSGIVTKGSQHRAGHGWGVASSACIRWGSAPKRQMVCPVQPPDPSCPAAP